MSLSIHFGPVENRPHLSILRECVDREIIWNLKLKADSQYNFLRRDMRFAKLLRQRHTVHNILHVCDILMHKEYYARALHVHPGSQLYSICVCRVSLVAKVELSSTSATGALRRLATARDRQFLVATVANRVSRRRKLYCESALTCYFVGHTRKLKTLAE